MLLVNYTFYYSGLMKIPFSPPLSVALEVALEAALEVALVRILVLALEVALGAVRFSTPRLVMVGAVCE